MRQQFRSAWRDFVALPLNGFDGPSYEVLAGLQRLRKGFNLATRSHPRRVARMDEPATPAQGLQSCDRTRRADALAEHIREHGPAAALGYR